MSISTQWWGLHAVLLRAFNFCCTPWLQDNVQHTDTSARWEGLHAALLRASTFCCATHWLQDNVQHRDTSARG